MKQIVTTGAVLARTNYGEADRIVTLLTPDHGKVRLMARGVRRSKSKLAGGIELFSVSDITLARSRGDIGTLVSSRLKTHYGKVLLDVDRTMAAYEMIKLLDRSTEDNCEPEYFAMLEQLFIALDDVRLPLQLVQLWFYGQLLRLHGFSPNLDSDTSGARLSADGAYTFDLDTMSFTAGESGVFRAAHIKLLRLLFGGAITTAQLARVEGVGGYMQQISPLVDAMRKQLLRV